MAKKTMHLPRRGDIYYITGNELMPPVGSEIWPDRMGIIVSTDILNTYSQVVEIVYLTTTNKKQAPTRVTISCGKKESTAICEQVQSVDVSRLSHYVQTCTDEEMENIDQALQFSLQISGGAAPLGLFKKWEQYIRTYGLDQINQADEDLIHENESLKASLEVLTAERDALHRMLEAKEKLLNSIHALSMSPSAANPDD